MMTRQRWRDIAPKTNNDRLKMDKIAPWCFLDHADPNRPKYPICPKGSIKPTQQGINAALHRAKMQKNVVIMTRAQKIKQDLLPKKVLLYTKNIPKKTTVHKKTIKKEIRRL